MLNTLSIIWSVYVAIDVCYIHPIFWMAELVYHPDDSRGVGFGILSDKSTGTYLNGFYLIGGYL